LSWCSSGSPPLLANKYCCCCCCADVFLLAYLFEVCRGSSLDIFVVISVVAFSALLLFVEHREGNPTCKNPFLAISKGFFGDH